MKSIFIGTLFNGESEFFEHSKAINSQDKVNYTHHVIKNLPEHEAHKQLWLDWESNQNKFDLFVKIDADTVLNRSTALYEITKLFEVDYNHKIVLKGESVSYLEPIAFHCLTPNSRQSFYYGFHRMIKKQKPILKLVASNWLINKDSSREWALRGALCAKKAYSTKIYYSSLKVEEIYLKNLHTDAKNLEVFASKLLDHE